MRPSYARKRLRHLRARRTMNVLAALCIFAALAIGVQQAVIAGPQAFFSRPPGVGASAPNDATKPQSRLAHAP